MNRRRRTWRATLLLASALLAAPRLLGAELIVNAPASLAASAARVERMNMTALGEALERAGLSLPDRVRVELVTDAEARAAGIPPWVAGLAHPPDVILIFPQRIGSYPYDSLDSVVRHEIVHLALAERADGRALPRWFHEGVAVSVDTGWGVSSRLRLLISMLGRPAPAQLAALFAVNDESAAAQAYLLSAALVDDVRRRHGADAPGRVASGIADGAEFDQAFSAATGVTPSQAADRAWAAYLRWPHWIPTLTSATAVWVVVLALAVAAYTVRRRHRADRRRLWDEND